MLGVHLTIHRRSELGNERATGHQARGQRRLVGIPTDAQLILGDGCTSACAFGDTPVAMSAGRSSGSEAISADAPRIGPLPCCGDPLTAVLDWSRSVIMSCHSPVTPGRFYG
jgi:hypothetical protein